MIDLDWNDIRIFLALYEGRSVRTASVKLGMSHSTVSRHLTDIETSLGVILFTRSRDGLLATSMAEQILARAQKIQSEVFELQLEASSLDTVLSGQVRITAPPPISQHMLMPHLVKFAKLYPGIDVILNSTYMFDDLMKGASDVALRSQFNPNDNLVGRRLPDFADRAYVSKEYFKHHWFEGNKTDANWIGRGVADPQNTWVKNSPFPDATIRHELPDLLDQAKGTVAGLGMSSLPCFYADQLQALMRIPNTETISTRPMWVLTHPDLRTSVRVKTLVRFLVKELTKQKHLITGEIE